MTLQNSYATLAEYKAWVTSPGSTLSSDTGDDTAISDILESSSRYIDTQTGTRTFYPRIETRSFDVPYDGTLWLDDDLCEVLTLTNGDDTTIASTEYVLKPRNYYPKFEICIRKDSNVYFIGDSTYGDEDVIELLGVWGYHDKYGQYAWTAGGTLAAAITTTTAATFTMTAGHTLKQDQIVKIDNELMCIGVSTNTITPIRRGDNGSTAATHVIGSTVYYWSPMEHIKQATLEIAVNAYHRRFGQNISGEAVVAPSGAVIGPRDVSAFAQTVISAFQRQV